MLTTHLLCITNPRTFINRSKENKENIWQCRFSIIVENVTITNYEVLKPAIYYSKNIIHPLKMNI